MINHTVYKKFVEIIDNYTLNQIQNASHQTICNILNININNVNPSFLENLRRHAYNLRVHHIKQAEFVFFRRSIIDNDLAAIKQKWPNLDLIDSNINGKRVFLFYPEGI